MIRSNRVVIGSFRPEDKSALFAWINDPELARHNAPYRPVTWESHCRWFETLGGAGNRVAFGVRELPDERLIGMTQLVDMHPVHRSAELTIRIGAAADRGRGLGSDALALTLDFAWRDLNLHRVGLHLLADNVRALRCYERVGFEVEGRRRQAAFIDGAWRDVVIMGILRPGASSAPCAPERAQP